MEEYTNNNGNPPYNNNPFSNVNEISKFVYQTNRQNNPISLGIVLKVMAGDNVDIFGKSFYDQPQDELTPINNPINVIDILTTLLSTNTLAPKNLNPNIVANNFPSNTSSIFIGQPNQYTYTPKASINWIILDEQFKFVSGGFDMVERQGNRTKTHQVLNVNIPKNGYIYVYCNNESNYDVYFDNLQIIHTPSAILEETHYYPFGLTMAGISSKAANITPNKYKFGGKELSSNDFSDGSGLESYDFGTRNFDPQLGRWHTIDPLSDQMRRWSPYNYAFNNPLRFIDPDGMSPIDAEKSRGTEDGIISIARERGIGRQNFNDWYKNNETGNYQWFDGSDVKQGWENIGSSYVINTIQSGSIIAKYNLISDGSITTGGQNYSGGAVVNTEGGHTITSKNSSGGGLFSWVPKIGNWLSDQVNDFASAGLTASSALWVMAKEGGTEFQRAIKAAFNGDINNYHPNANNYHNQIIAMDDWKVKTIYDTNISLSPTDDAIRHAANTGFAIGTAQNPIKVSIPFTTTVQHFIINKTVNLAAKSPASFLKSRSN